MRKLTARCGRDCINLPAMIVLCVIMFPQLMNSRIVDASEVFSCGYIFWRRRFEFKVDCENIRRGVGEFTDNVDFFKIIIFPELCFRMIVLRMRFKTIQPIT